MLIDNDIIQGGLPLAQNILFLDPGHAFGLMNREAPFVQNNFTLVDQYDLTTIDLSSFSAMIVHDFADQIYLARHRDVIETFLNEGKVVVFCGHLVREWLPGCAIFTPQTVASYKDYEVLPVTAHPIFEGVKMDELTFNKGVAGFFARGAHKPVPAGAEVLLALPNDMPITYIDRQTTNGTIFVHAGRDLFGLRMQKKSSDRISEQLLQWVKDEMQALKEGAQ